MAVKRGRLDYQEHANTEMARKFLNGDLQKDLQDAEAAYGDRKNNTGVAMYLEQRMGD